MKANLYNYPERLKKIKASIDTEISAENQKAIFGFMDFIKGRGGSESRQIKYYYYLRFMAKMLGKDFKDAIREDIEKLVVQIEETKKGETKRDAKITIKLFYRYIRGLNKDYPPEVNWIVAGKKTRNNIDRSLVLEDTDIFKLITSSQDLREKLFIGLLSFTGGRVGEVLSLTNKDFTTTDGRLIVELTNWKTDGKKRSIPIGEPQIILLYEEYRKVQPNRFEQDTFFFSDGRGNAIGLNFRRHLKDYAKAAGIDKPVNFHWFRHSRHTLWGEAGFSDRMLMYLGGWSNADMISNYVKSTEKLVLGKFDELYNTKDGDEIDKMLIKEIGAAMSKIMQSPTGRADLLKLLRGEGALPILQKTAITAKKYRRIGFSTHILSKSSMPLGRLRKIVKKRVTQPKTNKTQL